MYYHIISLPTNSKMSVPTNPTQIGTHFFEYMMLPS